MFIFMTLIAMYQKKTKFVFNGISFLQQAAYIINGNCKSVMNMSQPDQVELWRSVINGMSANC